MSGEPERRPRGRPPKSLLEDPDRFALVLMDSFQMIYGFSQRQAAVMAIAYAEGEKITPPEHLPLDYVWLSFKPKKKAYKKNPDHPTLRHFQSRADALRKKARRKLSDEEALWRLTMNTALGLGLGVLRAKPLPGLIGKLQRAEADLLPSLQALRAQRGA